MPKLMEVLTKDFLGQLETFSVKMETLLVNGYSGTRKSKAKGMSLEFSDFRPYIIGDDLRRIDWNSYGRFDKLFIKLFMEEKQGAVNIFLDNSISMDEGEPNKLFYGKLLAAAIAYVALKNMDVVSLYGFGETINSEKKNIKTKNQFFDFVKMLDEFPTGHKTKLTRSIKEIKNIPMTKGISFLFSDFFSQDGYEEAIKILEYKKQQIVLVHILSPEEINPKLSGKYRIVDKETGDYRDVELTGDKIVQYKKTLKRFQEKIESFCTERGFQYIFLSTDIPVLLGLTRCL